MTAQNNFSSNEQRMTRIGIGKNTRNMLIAVGKLEDAINMIAETIEDVFGTSNVDNTMESVLNNTSDLKNSIYYLVSLVIQEGQGTTGAKEL